MKKMLALSFVALTTSLFALSAGAEERHGPSLRKVAEVMNNNTLPPAIKTECPNPIAGVEQSTQFKLEDVEKSLAVFEGLGIDALDLNIRIAFGKKFPAQYQEALKKMIGDTFSANNINVSVETIDMNIFIDLKDKRFVERLGGFLVAPLVDPITGQPIINPHTGKPETVGNWIGVCKGSANACNAPVLLRHMTVKKALAHKSQR